MRQIIYCVMLVTILLIGINSDACFADYATISPNRYKCLDVLELEKVQVDPRNQTIRYTDPVLVRDYVEVGGWLSGWFSAWNASKDTDGNVTKGGNVFQIMPWIFSYCRAHPSKNLQDAAFEFMNAMRK